MKTGRPCSSQRARRGGFSLLEILLTVAVFGIAMAGLTGSQLTSIALSRSNREASSALDAAQSVLEQIQDEVNQIQDEDDFKLIYARWNARTDDDPPGFVSPGNAFDVRGLEPLGDDPDGRVGEVVFPGDGKVLREDLTDRLLGMPRDLDLDGETDAADHAEDYRILPVLVRVRWRSSSTAQQVQLVGTLARR